MFDEQYKLIISYLPSNKKYSCFIQKALPEGANNQENLNNQQQQDNQQTQMAENRIVSEEFQQFEFTFSLKRDRMKIKITDKCRRDAEKFGVKYYIVEEKIQKRTPYQLKVKIRYANYYSKCNAQKINFLKFQSDHIMKQPQGPQMPQGPQVPHGPQVPQGPHGPQVPQRP